MKKANLIISLIYMILAFVFVWQNDINGKPLGSIILWFSVVGTFRFGEFMKEVERERDIEETKNESH